MWLQELLSTDTHALGQRMSSNRISAADNEYTEGQVMLTGAKLCELIGPRSMAKTPLSGASRPDPGGLPAPGGSGRFCALRRGGRPMWAPHPLPLAPKPAASETPIYTRFGPPGPRLASRLLEEHGCSACSTKAL